MKHYIAFHSLLLNLTPSAMTKCTPFPSVCYWILPHRPWQSVHLSHQFVIESYPIGHDKVCTFPISLLLNLTPSAMTKCAPFPSVCYWILPHRPWQSVHLSHQFVIESYPIGHDKVYTFPISLLLNLTPSAMTKCTPFPSVCYWILSHRPWQSVHLSHQFVIESYPIGHDKVCTFPISLLLNLTPSAMTKCTPFPSVCYWILPHRPWQSVHLSHQFVIESYPIGHDKVYTFPISLLLNLTPSAMTKCTPFPSVCYWILPHRPWQSVHLSHQYFIESYPIGHDKVYTFPISILLNLTPSAMTKCTPFPSVCYWILPHRPWQSVHLSHQFVIESYPIGHDKVYTFPISLLLNLIPSAMTKCTPFPSVCYWILSHRPWQSVHLSHQFVIESYPIGHDKVYTFPIILLLHLTPSAMTKCTPFPSVCYWILPHRPWQSVHLSHQFVIESYPIGHDKVYTFPISLLLNLTPSAMTKCTPFPSVCYWILPHRPWQSVHLSHQFVIESYPIGHDKVYTFPISLLLNLTPSAMTKCTPFPSVCYWILPHRPWQSVHLSHQFVIESYPIGHDKVYTFPISLLLNLTPSAMTKCTHFPSVCYWILPHRPWQSVHLSHQFVIESYPIGHDKVYTFPISLLLNLTPSAMTKCTPFPSVFYWILPHRPWQSVHLSHQYFIESYPISHDKMYTFPISLLLNLTPSAMTKCTPFPSVCYWILPHRPWQSVHVSHQFVIESYPIGHDKVYTFPISLLLNLTPSAMTKCTPFPSVCYWILPHRPWQSVHVSHQFVIESYPIGHDKVYTFPTSLLLNLTPSAMTKCTPFPSVCYWILPHRPWQSVHLSHQFVIESYPIGHDKVYTFPISLLLNLTPSAMTKCTPFPSVCYWILPHRPWQSVHLSHQFVIESYPIGHDKVYTFPISLLLNLTPSAMTKCTPFPSVCYWILPHRPWQSVHLSHQFVIESYPIGHDKVYTFPTSLLLNLTPSAMTKCTPFPSVCYWILPHRPWQSVHLSHQFVIESYPIGHDKVYTFPISLLLNLTPSAMTKCTPFPSVCYWILPHRPWQSVHISHQFVIESYPIGHDKVYTFPISLLLNLTPSAMTKCTPFPSVCYWILPHRPWQSVHLSHQFVIESYPIGHDKVYTFPTSLLLNLTPSAMTKCTPFPSVCYWILPHRPWQSVHLSHQFVIESYPIGHDKVYTFPISLLLNLTPSAMTKCTHFPSVCYWILPHRPWQSVHLSHQFVIESYPIGHDKVYTFPISLLLNLTPSAMTKCTPFPSVCYWILPHRPWQSVHLSHQFVIESYPIGHDKVYTFPTSLLLNLTPSAMTKCTPFPPVCYWILPHRPWQSVHLSHQFVIESYPIGHDKVYTFPTSLLLNLTPSAMTKCTHFPSVCYWILPHRPWQSVHLSHQFVIESYPIGHDKVYTFPISLLLNLTPSAMTKCTPFPSVCYWILPHRPWQSVHLSHQFVIESYPIGHDKVYTFPISLLLNLTPSAMTKCTPFPSVFYWILPHRPWQSVHLSHQFVIESYPIGHDKVYTFPISLLLNLTPSAMTKCTPFPSVLSFTNCINAAWLSGLNISPLPSTPPTPVSVKNNINLL